MTRIHRRHPHPLMLALAVFAVIGIIGPAHAAGSNMP